MKGIVKNKTSPSRQPADAWATTLEQNINAIPLMDNVQLLAQKKLDPTYFLERNSLFAKKVLISVQNLPGFWRKQR
jgi:hypothetical protein